MAEGSQEVMTFESEEAKLAALDAFDEKTGDVEELHRIRNAEIKAPESTEEDAAEEKPAIPKKEEESGVVEKPEKPEAPKEPFTIKPEDLPEGMKTPGEVFKSFKEAQELIKRQGERIQKDQERMAELLASTQKADIAETRLKNAQEEVGVKTQKAEEAEDIPDSNLSKIMALQEELSKLDDPFDERALAINRELIPLQNQEIMRTNKIASRANEEAASLRKTLTEYTNRQDETSIAERNKVELKKQLDEVDEFSQMKEYKDEYGMSVSAAEADQKYIDWQDKVAIQYYGFLPNRNTEQGREQLSYAMYMLNQRSPNLIEKLRVANVPIEPEQDLERYLKLCELLDERDCIRYDPVQRKRVQLTRYNPQSGKHEPVSFPSLKATIEHKRVESGYYKQRELDAHKNGAKSFADAVNKRDTKELENETGSAAESQLSMEAAMKVLNEFNMDVASKKYYQTGDESVFDEYNAARLVMGQPKIDLTNVPSLKK